MLHVDLRERVRRCRDELEEVLISRIGLHPLERRLDRLRVLIDDDRLIERVRQFDGGRRPVRQLAQP